MDLLTARMLLVARQDDRNTLTEAPIQDGTGLFFAPTLSSVLTNRGAAGLQRYLAKANPGRSTASYCLYRVIIAPQF